MFIGRECYKYADMLSLLLDEQHARSKVSRKWLQPFLKAYVFIFGIPDVGFQLRVRYVWSIIKRLKFTRALDAGCGIGLNAFYLAKRNPKATVDACDVSRGHVNAAKLISGGQKLANVNVFRLDLTKLSDTDRYDLICCIDVMEHITDDSSVLANFSKAMKNEGVLVMSTPHKPHARRIKGGGHVRDGYTEVELRELLQRHGFEVKSIRHIWGFFGVHCEELYIWSLTRLPALAVLTFPILSLVSYLDMISRDASGYGLIVIAQKKANN